MLPRFLVFCRNQCAQRACKCGARTYSVRARESRTLVPSKALVTTRRTCKCVLSACKNAGKILRFVRASTDSVRNVEHAESTQTARSIFIACRTFSACGLLTLRLSLALRTTHLARAWSCVLHLARACCARDKYVVGALPNICCPMRTLNSRERYLLRRYSARARGDL